MPVALTVTAISDPAGQKRITAALTFTGSYPAGGDTIDLTTILGQSHLSKVAVFNSLPIASDPALGGGFVGEFIPGSALNNGKLKIFSSGGTEITAGTYVANATLLGASLNSAIEFIFDELL